ncbi:disulfide bond formation protein B [Pseudothioclava arenosa]|uniref:Disulfide bond formation protein B n=1 Tax=Pseudothioclava arenosa TaxID=1795308 RepID=A0A2A4CNE3_9RHOB|nr:disulfide bond formation protein B [Pseudothioclava arenosa]PCD76761.1 disulfide bond formation protein B [Pseudothioclava arenosa]
MTKTLWERFNTVRLVSLATLGSAGLLAGAFMFQALGYAPCDLCLLQRWPHVAAVLIGGAMLSLPLPRIFALFGAAAAATSGAIGIYHSGVELHIFEGPDSCTSNGVANLSVDELMAQINGAPLVRCDEITWQIFGLTMANMNVLLSFGLALVWILAFLHAHKGAAAAYRED